MNRNSRAQDCAGATSGKLRWLRIWFQSIPFDQLPDVTITHTQTGLSEFSLAPLYKPKNRHLSRSSLMRNGNELKIELVTVRHQCRGIHRKLYSRNGRKSIVSINTPACDIRFPDTSPPSYAKRTKGWADFSALLNFGDGFNRTNFGLVGLSKIGSSSVNLSVVTIHHFELSSFLTKRHFVLLLRKLKLIFQCKP